MGDSISGRLGNTALAADARLDGLRETGQERMAESREKLTENKEKVAAAIGTGQEKIAENRQKLETRITDTLEELQARRAQLEEKQKRLLAEYRSRFMVRRLGRAFPDIRKAIQEHLEHMDRE